MQLKWPSVQFRLRPRGVVAQSVECVLCKHEVVGSKPTNSIFLISWPSWLRRLLYTQKIVGSIPTEIIFFSLLAQLAERMTLNHDVVGSRPTQGEMRGTNPSLAQW